jgi:hypothetical protein
VVVRKQVKSKEGQPAKLTLRTKGPYQVIEKVCKNSYHIQKIPAIQSRTKQPGKLHKEAAMRLTKLPLTIVIHKRVDTADTRFMEQAAKLVHNPLEKSLGIFDFGKYATADPTKEDSTEDEDEGETDDERTPNENNNDTDNETLQIAQTDKHTTKRKHKQQDTHTEQQPIARTKTQHQEINIRGTRKLHEDIQASEDKLFIIKKT